MAKGMEKDGVLLGAFFTLCCLRFALRNFQAPQINGKVRSKGDLPLEEGRVGDFLKKLGVHESMGLDWMRPSAEGSGPCHCEATLDYFCKVIVVRGCF